MVSLPDVPKYDGNPGHVTDHNLIVDALTTAAQKGEANTFTGINKFTGRVDFGSGDATNSATVQKPAGDTRVAPINWIHNATVGDLIHVTMGPDAGGGVAAIGVGIDYGETVGIYVSNKSTDDGAIGIDLYNSPTSAGVGMKCRQYGTGDLIQVNQSASNTGDLVVIKTDSTATGRPFTIRDGLDNEYLYIDSDRILHVTSPNGFGEIKWEVAGTGQDHTIYSYSGAPDTFWVFDTHVVTNRLDFRSSGSAQAKGAETMVPVISISNNSKLSFFNATPTTKPTVTGSRGSNAALTSLLTQLATLGLITDSSS
jgi:hypothetical protein